MKKLLIMIFAITVGLSAQAQTKKTAPAKKATVTTKAPKKSEQQTSVSKPTIKTTKQSNSNAGSSSYKMALGIKFIYGISATGKFFLNEHSALEAIVRVNGAGGLGTNIALTGLYEYHENINAVNGLRWYIGGGGYANYFTWKDSDLNPVTTFGAAGILGLEYKFNGIPLAISADWQPGYVISDGIGFSAENGGIGVKYTF